MQSSLGAMELRVGRGKGNSPALRLCVGGLLAVFGFALPVAGSPRRVSDKSEETNEPTPRRTSGGERSLRTWSGLGALGKRLQTDPNERKLALARLSERGTPQALRVIAQWLETAQDLDARDWLDVSRALARHAHQPDARRWLMRILSGAPLVSSAKTNPQPQVAELSRAIAALALAKVGGEESLHALVTALGQGEHTARWARAALVAHPPRNLEPLLASSSAARAELVTTLDELGDQRSFEALRGMVRAGTAELQARAVLALFHHGQLETVEVAKHWAKTATAHAGLLAAATEILLATHAPEAPKAFNALLALDTDSALQLAKRFPSAALSEALALRLPSSTHEEHVRILALLGVTGGPQAIEALRKDLNDPGYGLLASEALAGSSDPSASQTLLTALANPKTEVLALRALVARGFQTRQSFAEVTLRLQRFAASAQAEKRVLGHWGLAVASEQHATKLLQSEDFTLVAAALSTLWVHGDALAEQALERLLRAKTSQLRVALAMGLGSERIAARVSSARLHALLDDVEALAPVVAPWLTARREERFPSRIEGLLANGDTRIAAAALLGLGKNPDPKSAALLGQAYRDTVDLRVRRAAVAASAERVRHAQRAADPDSRNSVERPEPLPFAADFDPDPTTRALAHLSEPRPSAERGTGSLWITQPKASPNNLVLITTEDGRTRHALLPPNRVLVLLGFSALDPQVESVDW